MAGSYMKFNYNLRASKSVERKMILEVLKELCPPSVIKKYQYIGLGSVFYTDFRLFHKDLNICDMICIEGDIENEERFEFNKPYKCVDLKMGHSSEELPKLKWEKLTICWLDYDNKLEPFMFDDIRTIINNAKNRTYLIITCNANPSSYRKNSTIAKEEIEDFKEKFNGAVPINIAINDFTAKKIIPLIHQMFTSYISETLNDKNAALPVENQLEFKQLFSFKYQDNSTMYTFGGVFLNSEDNLLNEYDITKYDYIRTNNLFYEISIPKLTNREIDILNLRLPNTYSDFLSDTTIEFIPEEFRDAYFKLYKHFPNYMEIKDF